MKAQLVYENINFQRGQEPKDSMRIGRAHQIKSILEEMVTEFNQIERAQIISIFYNFPYHTTGDEKPHGSLTIKGDKHFEHDFFEEIKLYLHAWNLDFYLKLPGRELYGSYSYPIVRCDIKPKYEKYFQGLVVDA